MLHNEIQLIYRHSSGAWFQRWCSKKPCETILMCSWISLKAFCLQLLTANRSIFLKLSSSAFNLSLTVLHHRTILILFPEVLSPFSCCISFTIVQKACCVYTECTQCSHWRHAFAIVTRHNQTDSDEKIITSLEHWLWASQVDTGVEVGLLKCCMHSTSSINKEKLSGQHCGSKREQHKMPFICASVRGACAGWLLRLL